ncbi:MAG: sulfatase-like hydrolase/transferase [Planctomycetota bacterium]
MNQRLLTSFLCVLATLATSSRATAGPPNIVFFFADDQTTDALGCYGNSVVSTPTIDSLARKGTRFENMFVSHSICWVSRTTILTGLTGRGYGTAANPDVARPDAVKTLVSDLLRDQGYRTGYFGKWHAKMPKGFRAEEHFDEFQAIGRNPYYKKLPDDSLRHETELIIDRGVDFIAKQSDGKPFALNLWFNACHAEDKDRRPGIGHFPWPRSVDGMYDDVVFDEPRLNDPEIFDALPDFLKTTINRQRFFWRWNTSEKYQANMRAYYRMVTGIDQGIARVLEALERKGIADNTIIVYSADNGYHMGNRGLAGKWSHFEESLRVPLIVFDPRVAKDQRGRVVDEIALNVDLPATFLDWAGASIPERYQGRPLTPVLESGKEPVAEWREDSFHEHFAVRNRIPAFEGIRGKRFKYARYFDHDMEFLHDLQNDPDELVNLAEDSQYADVLRSLRERTDQRVKELGGPIDPLKGKFTASTVPHPKAAGALLDEGFQSLFDGRSLRGWTGDRKYWSVQDGAITGVTDGSVKKNRFLSYEGSTVQNFDLRMKVKVSKGGNSGIQYRGISRPEMGLDIVTGYQCDVVADVPGYNGMLYEEKGRRILARTGQKVVIDEEGQPWVVGGLAEKTFAPDEWHQYRVLVRGNHHQHWIDDHMTVDVIDLDEDGRVLEGVLAMQVHVGPPMRIQYKDIRIQHLPDDMPLQTAEQHPIPGDAKKVVPQGGKRKRQSKQ